MYSLDCPYFTLEFNSLEDLIDNVTNNGMDPNYEITHNGEGTGEKVIDFITF
jgi:hypothetical protein